MIGINATSIGATIVKDNDFIIKTFDIPGFCDKCLHQ